MSLSLYQLLNQLVYIYKIQQGGHAIGGELDAVGFYVVAATTPKRRMSRL
jgi:hypothetical protein